ncbi:hypothetical protein Tco_0373197 [Tanacetum coccineum]
MVGNSIYIVTSVLTQGELDHHCSVFNILADLRPELPDRNATIKDSSAWKIGMYTHFIEFDNFRIPLSKFLLCVLEYYQINLSQLSVIGAAKVSHFELMCRVLGRVPTVGTFRRLYVNSISNGWLSFSKSGGVNDPCCYSKKFDSLKNWNNCFFWIDASVCPLSLPWFDGVSVIKDPLSVDEAVDFPVRSFIETDVRPMFLHNNDDEMGFLDFVISADPFKLRTEERTLTENKVSLLTETEDRVISPYPQIISLVDYTIQNELNVNVGKRKKKVAFIVGSPHVKKARTKGVVVVSDSRPATAGKSPTALRRLIDQSGQAGTGFGSNALATEDFVSSSVTLLRNEVIPPVPFTEVNVNAAAVEPSSEARNSSAPEGGGGALSATPSQGSSTDDFYESQTIDSATALNVYAPNWNVTNIARIDNPATCQNFLDHVTPPGHWAALRNQHDARFLDCFNINYAQHTCMVSELRLRYEHEIMTREKYEKKFTNSVVAEAVEVVELRKRMSDLEVAVVAKVSEVTTLVMQNAELLGKVSALELVREELDGKVSHMTSDCDSLRNEVVGEAKMREEFTSRQDEAARHFNERATELDARIANIPAQVEAYEPGTEGKYVAMVSEFENVSFPLLEELEGLKDSPLALIMSALTLKDDHGLLRGGVVSAPSSAPGGVSSSAPPHDSSLGVVDYQVSTLVLSGDGAPATQSPVTQPHDDLFGTSILDKPVDP